MGVDRLFFMAIFNAMSERGRPPKAPKDRKSTSIRIPLTTDELERIKLAATEREAKPITWAREAILKATKRKA